MSQRVPTNARWFMLVVGCIAVVAVMWWIRGGFPLKDTNDFLKDEDFVLGDEVNHSSLLEFRSDVIEGPRDGIAGQGTASESVGPITLADVSDRTGITFEHDDGGGTEKYLFEAISAGIAVFDYDNDGFSDIYFLSGAPLAPRTDVGEVNRLYRNIGNGKFLDVTDQAGVGDPGFGCGVACSDYDQDGSADIYVNNFGPNVLYRSHGDGTFIDSTEAGGVDGGFELGAGVTFFDADGSGDLDLFVANYNQARIENHVRRSIDGFHCYPGPLDFAPSQDLLYENTGTGEFLDVSEQSGITSAVGNGMGVVAADFDDDGDPDIFVANDMGPNFLYENDGNGVFSETGLVRGVAYDFSGSANGNMGVDVGDFNNDGMLDLYSTNYSNQLPNLYENLGKGVFQDVAIAVGGGVGMRPHVNWGVGFADFDNDGLQDIFIANGALDQNVHKWRIGTAFKVRNQLLRNLGGRRFEDISWSAGSGLAVVESSRGLALDDFENDGLMDVVVQNSRSRPTVMRNRSGDSGNWIFLKLVGTKSNRPAIGSRVHVSSALATQTRELVCGRGYQSYWGERLHFGVGDSKLIDRVEIRWRSGFVEELTQVPVNCEVLIIEGRAANFLVRE